jgi:phosphatidylserine decarboxylase
MVRGLQVSGKLGRVVDVDGEFFTVNPIAVRQSVNVYTDNIRCGLAALDATCNMCFVNVVVLCNDASTVVLCRCSFSI